MDFADEPYVRKYTRKTLTSRLLGWEGRAVMDAMLGEFDAAGIFAIRGDATSCVSAITELPVEIVRVGLERLVETETWVITDRSITWPTFEEAQNCSRSDRVRKREYRKRRADAAITGRDPTRQGFVYVLRANLSGIIKIGFSSEPEARISALQTGIPGGVELIASWPAPITEETQALKRFAHLRTNGEWFSDDGSIVEWALRLSGTDVPESPRKSQSVTLPPSHPPSAPTHPGDRARARGEQSTEPDQSRAHDLPCEQPPQEYLDAAQMGGVSLAQAKSTWKHYWGNGLPPNGVLRLIPWLVQRAKERQERTAKAPPSRTQATRKPLTAEEALKQCP